MLKYGLNRLGAYLWLLILLPIFSVIAYGSAHAQIPDFVAKSQAMESKGEQTAVLAGGCFWGVDAVFKHVKGVSSVVSGYSGGSAAAAKYEIVSTGATGHAESVKITYDPSQISYGQLLNTTS